MKHKPVIICRDVTVGYGRQIVLSYIDLQVHRSSIVVLIGPNGAGKTTLLYAILGLVPVRSGRIDICLEQARLAYVPQQKLIDPLYPVTGKRIIQMGLHHKLGLWRMPDPQMEANIERTMEWLGISREADKVFCELSGGTRQKVMLARALVGDADIMILDEPTSELDEQSEDQVLRYIRELCNERAKTVVMAIHGLSKAIDLADDVYLVERGRLVGIKGRPAAMI